MSLRSPRWHHGHMTRTLRTFAILLAASSAAVLSGCAASGASYAVLDRDAQAGDEIQVDLPAYAGDEADLSTSRYVGEHDGTSLWLMRGTDDSRVCLLAYAEDEKWVIGCGGETGLGVGGVAGRFDVVPDGVPGPDGATQLSENVYGY